MLNKVFYGLNQFADFNFKMISETVRISQGENILVEKWTFIDTFCPVRDNRPYEIKISLPILCS